MVQVQCALCKKDKDYPFEIFWRYSQSLGRCNECHKTCVKKWCRKHKKIVKESGKKSVKKASL